MTNIYSLAPINDTTQTLTTINTNIDGLETAIGTQADTPNAAGSLLARLAQLITHVDGLESALGTTGDAASATAGLLARIGHLITLLDQLEGFTDGIEGVLGTASATPAANTLNSNLLRTMRAASGCSSVITAPAPLGIPASNATAPATVVTSTTAVDWRKISIYNAGTVPILIALGGNATTSVYSFPLPVGFFCVPETLGLVTAISSGAATSVLVTVES